MFYNINNSKEVLSIRKELLQGLSEEQIKKVEACKSSEEILNLAKAEGMELTDEQLEAVSGGGCSGTLKCKKCGSKVHKPIDEEYNACPDYSEINYKYECKKCGHTWWAK